MELPNDAPPQDLSAHHPALLEVHQPPAVVPRPSASPPPTPVDVTADLPSLAISTGNMAMDFGRGLGQSFLHTVVQSPLEGAAQTFDHTVGETFGSNLFEKTKDLIVSEPKAAVFGTAEWHGQSIGGALGMVPWFIATRSAVRGGAGVFQATRGLVVSEAEAAIGSKVLSSTAAKLALEGGTTGAAYAAVFKPVDSGSGNYWSAKSSTMAGDFATFATLTASSLALAPVLKSATLPLIEKYPGASKLTQAASSMLAGGLSGAPAAGVETVAQYLQSGDTSSLSLDQFCKNVYSYGIVGGALGAGQLGAAKRTTAKVAGETSPTASVNTDQTEAVQTPLTKTVNTHQNEAAQTPETKTADTQPIESAERQSNTVDDISKLDTSLFFLPGKPSSSFGTSNFDSMPGPSFSDKNFPLFSKTSHVDSTGPILHEKLLPSSGDFELGSFLASLKPQFKSHNDNDLGSKSANYLKYYQDNFVKHSSKWDSYKYDFNTHEQYADNYIHTHSSWENPEDSIWSPVRTSKIGSELDTMPNAHDFMQALAGRAIGTIPEPFLKSGLREKEVVDKLDALAKALRALDGSLPPQKKFGSGAEDLNLRPFKVGLGDSTMLVSKVDIGEVAHVYKISIDGQDFAFKVHNDPGRMDVHGSYAETAAFASLANEKISDLIDFHAANPGTDGGWMLNEFVSKPVERSGRPLAEVLAERGLELGDDWSANRGPGNVVWDLGGIEPTDVARPKSLEEFQELVETPSGEIIAARKLDGIKNQAELKDALLLSLEHPALGGQVARTAARRLSNPSDLADVLSQALEQDGAAGRAAFELDRLANTPYATTLFYKALLHPEARAEAAKQIDKLPPQDRKAAFDAAFVYPEARAMAARSISSIPGDADRADASAAAAAFPSSNFVHYHDLAKVRALTAEEQADQQRAFEEHFENFGLTVGNKLTNDVPPLSFDQWWNAHKDESHNTGYSTDDVKRSIEQVFDDLKESHKTLPLDQLHDLSTAYFTLNQEDWQSMTPQEAAAHGHIVREYNLYSDQSRVAFDWPDFKVWLKANHDAISSMDHYSVKELADRWPELPEEYKKLDPKSLYQISDVWHEMAEEDWQKIPASSAVNVARTISALRLDQSSTQDLARSPDFAKWFTDNIDSLQDMPREDMLPLIKIWDKLTPEQRSLPHEEISKLARSIGYRAKLEAVLSPGSAAVEYLLSPEGSKNDNANRVLEWLNGLRYDPLPVREKAKALVEQMARDGSLGEAFHRTAMQNKLSLDVFFSDKPQFQIELAQRFPNHSELAAVLHFIRLKETRNKPLMEFAIKNGFNTTEREFEKLRNTSSLATKLDLNSDETNYLYLQRLSGLRVSELEKYLAENPSAKDRVKALIEQKANWHSLDARYLVDRDSLASLSQLNADQMAWINVLQSKGLSATRLRQHLAETPDDYPVIKRLLDRGADVKQFNDYMRLSVLPSDVDLKLVDSIEKGQITTGDVLAGLRDWKSGRAFQELLIKHVESGAELSPKTLADLRAQAASLPATPPPLATGKRGDSNLNEAVAQTFVEALEGIEKTIPADKPIVLLGRDAWPLLPLLRAAGRDAHYFLWSRLQYDDEGTQQQWLKEIPPNAAVIDTGYAGSIIDQIKRIDPGVTGYLMSTSNDAKYPRLLSSPIHTMKVGQVEGFPKLIHRSSAHTRLGNAVARRNPRDNDADTASSLEMSSRWYIERQARALLRAAGLPRWDVWRYGQFTGLTPTERLGVSNEVDVQRHYQFVEQARAREAEKPNSPAPDQ